MKIFLFSIMLLCSSPSFAELVLMEWQGKVVDGAYIIEGKEAELAYDQLKKSGFKESLLPELPGPVIDGVAYEWNTEIKFKNLACSKGEKTELKTNKKSIVYNCELPIKN